MSPSSIPLDKVPDSARRTDKLTVAAWALWDWGAAAFHAVLVTFIFAVYLTDSVGDTINSRYTPAQWLSFAVAVAGVAIFAVTPIMGQRADIHGTRKRSLAMWSLWTFLIMIALFFIRNDAPIYFWSGLVLLAIGTITIEFAEVNYFAQLSQVATTHTVGKVSGLGWSAGYFGGIFLLLLCYVGFVSGEGGLLGLSTTGGFNIRVVALVAAIWFGLSCVPGLIRVPEIPPRPEQTGGILDSYRKLFTDVKSLWHTDRNACYFLFASAIFRDGLAGVFSFGAILGVTVYGLSAGDVLIFGVAANVAAALGAVAGGLLDDKVGPKPIILTCLTVLSVTSFTMFFLEGPLAFWVGGLILCSAVGPAQSSARSFLARVAPVGKEGQMFGLYATTGRSVSWLSPALFGLFVSLLGQGDRGGIIAIALVIALGALVLIPVRDPHRRHYKSSITHTQ